MIVIICELLSRSMLTTNIGALRMSVIMAGVYSATHGGSSRIVGQPQMVLILVLFLLLWLSLLSPLQSPLVAGRVIFIIIIFVIDALCWGVGSGSFSLVCTSTH